MRDTIEMAREAGLDITCDPTETPWRTFVEGWEDQLKTFEALVRADEREPLQAEVERLNKALTWEQNRAGHIGTHAPGCHTWGPAHYECLLRVNAELVEALRVARHMIIEDGTPIGWSVDRLSEVIDKATGGTK
jgi:hypothetical protein